MRTFDFAEGVAEAALLLTGCALSAPEIYRELPKFVRNQYSRHYFSKRLRASNRLHYDEEGQKFYVKIESADGSPSVPIQMVLTSAAATILQDIEGSIGSQTIYSRLESHLQSKVSQEALQSMLLVGAAANPVITINKFGEWHLAGSAMPTERRPSSRDMYPQLEEAVRRRETHAIPRSVPCASHGRGTCGVIRRAPRPRRSSE